MFASQLRLKIRNFLITNFLKEKILDKKILTILLQFAKFAKIFSLRNFVSYSITQSWGKIGRDEPISKLADIPITNIVAMKSTNTDTDLSYYHWSQARSFLQTDYCLLLGHNLKLLLEHTLSTCKWMHL